MEDYPFTGNNNGGVGEITVGLKLGLLSERRGTPLSLSVRPHFPLPHRILEGLVLELAHLHRTVTSLRAHLTHIGTQVLCGSFILNPKIAT